MKEGITSILTDFYSKLTLRFVIIAVALIPSVAIYRYFIDFYNEENDFISLVTSHLLNTKKVFKLYAKQKDPSEATIYYQIGDQVESLSKISTEIEVLHKGKNGALENFFNVANNKKSFGLIQEDSLLHAEFLEQHVRFITPLYMERLHILYRCPMSSSQGTGQDELVSHDKCPQILSKSDDATGGALDILKAALSKANMFSAGPPGSGARLFLPYLLHYHDISRDEMSNLANFSFGEMINAMENGRIDVAIFIAGTSNKVLDMVNRNPDVHLLGIDPVDIFNMKNKYKQGFRATDFGTGYKAHPFLPTIGAYASLICSNDVSNSEIGEFLSIMEKAQEKALADMFNYPPISLSGVTEVYTVKGESESWSLWKSLIIFLITVTLSTLVASSVLQWIVSSSKEVLYYKRMMVVYRNTMSQSNISSGFNEEELELHFHKALIFINGMKSLEEIMGTIREDYDTGGMTMSHHKYLLDNNQAMLNIFQDKFVQKLVTDINLIDRSSSLTRNLENHIKKWFSEGYLTVDSYEFLMRNLKGHVGQDENTEDHLIA